MKIELLINIDVETDLSIQFSKASLRLAINECAPQLSERVGIPAGVRPTRRCINNMQLVVQCQ